MGVFASINEEQKQGNIWTISQTYQKGKYDIAIVQNF